MKLRMPSLAVLGMIFVASAASAAERQVNIGVIPAGGIAKGLRQVAANASYYESGVALGSTGAFAILAATTVTNTGASVVTGEIGVSPGTTVTGFPPGILNGPFHLGDPAAAQAQLDLTIAYNDAAGRTAGAVAVAGNLGGQTLTPGLYKSTTSLEISSGDLTLDAQGDPSGVFLFEMASTLVTTTGRQVILAGGAQATNIYWQVGSSATLGTTSVFKGNILALASITAASGAGVEGRLLARTGGVSLDGNVVTVPANNTAGVTPDGGVPNRVSLARNPLRSESATIRFGLAKADRVGIKVYDVSGRMVRDLLDRHFEPGEHEVMWDRLDSSGRSVSRGLYFTQVSYGSQGFVATKKLMIIQ
jgi:ice-binding like protein